MQRPTIELNDLICDLLFYQYIIKTESSPPSDVETEEEDEPTKSIHAYEMYKTILSQVLDIVQRNQTIIQEKRDQNLVDEARIQLQTIKRDVLMVEKAALIQIGKSSGMHTVASKIDMLQRALLKSGEKGNVLIQKHEKNEEGSVKNDPDSVKNDPGNDISDGYISLEDKSAEEDDNTSEDELQPSENDSSNASNEKPEDVVSESENTDKIIPIEGTLPKAFVTNNDMLSTKNEQKQDVEQDTQELLQNDNMEPIKYFHKTKEWGWLSSFHPGLFYFKDRRYRTVEHAFHAQKSDDAEYQGPFSIDSPVYIGDSALAAKHRGSKKNFETSTFVLRPDWEEVRVQIMKECVEAFYKAHPELEEKLVKTLPAPLHHTGYKVGTFWGMQKGKGENQHGKILMALRKRLASKGAKHGDEETKTE